MLQGLANIQQRVSTIGMVLVSQEGVAQVHQDSQTETLLHTPPHVMCPTAPALHRPKVKLEPIKLPSFSGELLDFPAWRRDFRALLDSQDLPEAIGIIYLRDAIPPDLTYLLSPAATLE